MHTMEFRWLWSVIVASSVDTNVPLWQRTLITKGGHTYVGVGDLCEISIHFSQCCCEPKTTLKKMKFLFQKTKQNKATIKWKQVQDEKRKISFLIHYFIFPWKWDGLPKRKTCWKFWSFQGEVMQGEVFDFIFCSYNKIWNPVV